jgi:hypothetical protein
MSIDVRLSNESRDAWFRRQQTGAHSRLNFSKLSRCPQTNKRLAGRISRMNALWGK